MAYSDRQTQDVIALQETVLRLAERDHGLTPKRIAAETGIAESVLRSYKNGTAMPLHNAVRLAAVLPDHLVSLWFESAGKAVIDVQSDEDVLLHRLLREATGYSAEHCERAADGVICHRDKEALRERARSLAAAANRIAAG